MTPRDVQDGWPRVRTGWLLVVLALLTGSQLLPQKAMKGDPSRQTSASENGSSGSSATASGLKTGDSRPLDIVKRELQWWFPGPVALVSVVTVALLYIAHRYYGAFYTAFGVDPVQVGATQTDTTFRLLPWGITIALLVGLFRLSVLSLRINSSASQASTKKPMFRPLSPFAKAMSVLPMGVIVIFATLGVANLAVSKGKEDARAVVTSDLNYVYSSLWQQWLGTKTLVAELRWIGPQDTSVLPRNPAAEDDDPYTIARLIAQWEDTTLYFDLVDCSVYSVPTTQIALTYGPTNYADGSPPKLRDIASCKSDIE